MEKMKVEYITPEGEYKTEEVEWKESSDSDEGDVVEWSDAVEEGEGEPHGFAPESSNLETHKVKIVSFAGWIQFMVRGRIRCTGRVLGKRLCTKYPQLHRRTSTIEVYALVKYPASFEAAAKEAVKKCAVVGAAAAVVAATGTGGVGAGPAFGTAFYACLKAQIGPDTDLVKFEVPPPITSNSTGWKPV
jgi:hypothetical protein